MWTKIAIAIVALTFIPLLPTIWRSIRQVIDLQLRAYENKVVARENQITQELLNPINPYDDITIHEENRTPSVGSFKDGSIDKKTQG